MAGGTLMRDRTTLGQLLETFVFQELRRLASWHEQDIRFHHFRDRDNFEVDIVLERGAHELVGVTVPRVRRRGRLRRDCSPRAAYL